MRIKRIELKRSLKGLEKFSKDIEVKNKLNEGNWKKNIGKLNDKIMAI